MPFPSHEVCDLAYRGNLAICRQARKLTLARTRVPAGSKSCWLLNEPALQLLTLLSLCPGWKVELILHPETIHSRNNFMERKSHNKTLLFLGRTLFLLQFPSLQQKSHLPLFCPNGECRVKKMIHKEQEKVEKFLISSFSHLKYSVHNVIIPEPKLKQHLVM